MFAEFYSYWWLALLIFPLAWLGKIFWEYRKKQHDSYLFQNNQNIKISGKNFQKFWAVKIFLVLLGLGLILLAVWRPQWGQELQKTEKKGLDIVFTVDVSKSMKALDFSTASQYISRLDATKYLVEKFIKKRKSDRIGLVEFAGESFVASPLTLDHSVFLNFLKNISSDDVGKQGTNLAEALEVSISRLEVQSTEKRGKAILLFSDGDETISSEAEKMAELAKEKNIKIFTVGVGSEDGMPIPEGQNRFGEIVYKKWKGETVLTALNSDPLEKIAEITGGKYFHAENVDDLQDLMQDLEKLPKKILTEEKLSPESEKYFWFALLGMMFFVGGMILPISVLRKNIKI